MMLSSTLTCHDVMRSQLIKQQLLTTDVDIKGGLKFMLWPVVLTWSAMADEWSLLTRALKCSVFLSWSLRFVFRDNPSNQLYKWPSTSEIGLSDLCMENKIWCCVCFGRWSWDWRMSRNCIRRISDVWWPGYFEDLSKVAGSRYLFWDL